MTSVTSCFVRCPFEVHSFPPPFPGYVFPNAFVDSYPTFPQHTCREWKHSWLSTGFPCSPDHPHGPSLHLSQLASQPLVFHPAVFTGSRILSFGQSSLVCWVRGGGWQHCLKCSVLLEKTWCSSVTFPGLLAWKALLNFTLCPRGRKGADKSQGGTGAGSGSGAGGGRLQRGAREEEEGPP